MLKLIEITPEGKIVAALAEGQKSYSELKFLTGLSDRWLSKKLKELSSAGIIGRRGKRYQLKKLGRIIDSDSIFARFLLERLSLRSKAKLIADELSDDERVLGIILFGSVAKNEISEESDIDLLVITEEEMEEELNGKIYDLMFKYNVPVESISLTLEDLIINLYMETTFAFGLLESYVVLFDRGGIETLLFIKRKKILEDWIYDEEAGAWIQKKLRSTLKSPKTK